MIAIIGFDIDVRDISDIDFLCKTETERRKSIRNAFMIFTMKWISFEWKKKKTKYTIEANDFLEVGENNSKFKDLLTFAPNPESIRSRRSGLSASHQTPLNWLIVQLVSHRFTIVLQLFVYLFVKSD